MMRQSNPSTVLFVLSDGLFRLGKAVCLTLGFLSLVSPAMGQQQNFHLRSGDRVVFYGDSITEQMLYTTFVETFVVTRWPEMAVSFVNSGWSGDRVTGGRGGLIDLRLKRDVIDHRPSVVTIMLGMNDGNVAPFDVVRFNTFANGYKHIVSTLKQAQPDLRFTLIKPSPYDDVTRPPLFEGGYNSVLIRYGDFVADLSKEMKLDFADLNTSVTAALKKANSLDATTAQRIIPDRVHPRPGGHLLMAQALLRAWNAPAVVSTVEIDAARTRPIKTENTQVTGVVFESGTLSWTQRDRSLPMPLDLKDPALALAVQAGSFTEEFNLQLLKVTSLIAENYVLEIDGEEVGTFSRETLMQGVNLATLPTPMLKQALAVHTLTMDRNQIQFVLWRDLSIRFQGEGAQVLENARVALAALESDLYKRQKERARPVAHRFKLNPSPAAN